MKVLWITNIVFPEAIKLLAGEVELKSSGGWLLGSAESLVEYCDIELYVATVSNIVGGLTKLQGEKITYYLLPLGKGNLRINKEYEPYWRKIESDIKPDVVHIHGTEYSQGYAYMTACGANNVVISIQGLTSSLAHYYCYGMTQRDILKNITLRDVVKGTVIKEQEEFRRRSEYELESIKLARRVIGRTSWDKSKVWAINPKAQYLFCNETLRAEFYDGSKWKYENCIKHSIFLSQAGYPIKGLHQVLKAMPLILRHYPDASIRVAGRDITCCSSLYEKVRLSGYAKYLKSLMHQAHMDEKLVFTGNLNAEGMKREYLNANVFICPSAIENSPNSLGEAQMLGTPCLASYVGGVIDMMKGNEDNLYRFEEVEMLAEKVCRVFETSENQVDMSAIAARRHNRKRNAEQLYSIYALIDEN